MKYGKYAIIDQVVHKFVEEEAWFWKINPPTSGNELTISKFLVQGRAEQGLDGVRREYPPTNAEVMHREVALLFGGTNIPMSETPVEDGGNAILKDNASVESVEAVLRGMPHPMVLEIWDAIGEACPGWGPLRPNGPRVKSPAATLDLTSES